MTEAQRDMLKGLIGGLLVAGIAANLYAFSGAFGKPAPVDPEPLVRALGDPRYPPVPEAAPLVIFPDYPGERNAAQRMKKPAPTLFGFIDWLRSRVSTACLPDSIKRALSIVQRACGPVTVTSAHRPGARVAGSGRVSLHASCRAADFQIADWRCVLTTLTRKVWPYGLSTDYLAVNHYHISDSRREGRFVHWRGGQTQYAAKKSKRTRTAKRHYRARVQVAYVQERGQ